MSEPVSFIDPTELLGVRTVSAATPLPVSGSFTSVGTTPVSIATSPTSIAKAEDAPAVSGDVGIALFGVRAPAVPAAQTSAAGDYGSTQIDAEGKQTINLNSVPDLTWQYSADNIVATPVVGRVAAAAGVRNYVSDITLSNSSATAVTVSILDGATVIFKVLVPAGSNFDKTFTTPLRGTAATAVNVQASVATTTLTVCLAGYVSL